MAEDLYSPIGISLQHLCNFSNQLNRFRAQFGAVEVETQPIGVVFPIVLSDCSMSGCKPRPSITRTIRSVRGCFSQLKLIYDSIKSG